jgi:exodeoxyribonuclease VII large subunit
MRINTLLLYDNFYDQNATPKMPFCQYNCKADFGGLIYLSMNGLIYLSAIGNGKIIAQIRCTIWNRDLDTIKRVFREHDLELKLENGTVVGFQCSLQYSPQYSLSLKAVAADPTFALGELELRKKQIIDRLNKEGLFEINKRLSVPLLPQRIGLVASKDSAGFNDILKTFETASFGFKIYLADAIVQGNQAERCVLKALDALEKLQVDLVIIARGGAARLICRLLTMNLSPGESHHTQSRCGQVSDMRLIPACLILWRTDVSKPLQQWRKR